MSDNSKIEWTDATWNPVRGCTKISDGCKNCYAYAFAERWRGIKGHPFEKGFDVVLVRDNLDIPIKWKRPRMIFVNSMSDLFHEKVPDEFIKQVIQVMLRARQHIYQVLTKRPERMRDFLQKNFPNMELHPHIWWGVSVENKRQGLPRIDILRETPAALRFLSCEPLLEDLGPMNLSFIDWIIVVQGAGYSSCQPSRINSSIRASSIMLRASWGSSGGEDRGAWSSEHGIPCGMILVQGCE